MRLTRKELIFTVGLTNNFDACLRMLWVHILMSASELCIHVFARLFVHQSVASARLSVRPMIVYQCARRFIFRPSICLIFRPSADLSVCMYVNMYMYLCRDEHSSV